MAISCHFNPSFVRENGYCDIASERNRVICDCSTRERENGMHDWKI